MRTAGSGAAERDLTDAADLGELLLDHRIGAVVELRPAQGVRGQGQDHDRRVGRVELAPGRIGAQRRRQVRARCLDRRLDVARGAVDVAIDIELDGDGHGTDVAGRGQLVHAGDRGQAFFQRLGDGGRHGFGRRPRRGRLDDDHGEGDVRQGRHRQVEIGERPGQEDRDSQQRRRHRPIDEEGGDLHVGLPAGRETGLRLKRRERRSKAR